ncbi:hypothetical protein MRX96_037899 [Rhipicephalus microplus]
MNLVDPSSESAPPGSDAMRSRNSSQSGSFYICASASSERAQATPQKWGNETVPAVSLDEPETSVGRAPDAEPVGSLFSASSDNTATSIDRDPEPVGSPFCELTAL